MVNEAVSIVVATADRVRCVYDCVSSFRAQVPGSVELIVVDAGEDDQVDEQALRKLWRKARVIRAEERSASNQRNAGVDAAEDEIVIFLDDDVIVNPGWWPKILEPFGDPQVAVVQGGIWNSRTPVLRSDRGGYVKWNGTPEACIGRGPDAPRELDWPMTTNMAVRKSVYQSVGGLDPYFVIYEEDVDFGLRVRKAGWRIVHAPEASVYHYGHRMWRPPATKQLIFRKGRNLGYMLTKNYGLSVKLILFLMTKPVSVVSKALMQSLQLIWRSVGHAGSYLLGICIGVKDGFKNTDG